jgi:hypothetical protein
LPNTSRSCREFGDIKQVTFDPAHYSDATIETILKDETGHTVQLSRANVKVSKLKSVDEMVERFAGVL